MTITERESGDKHRVKIERAYSGDTKKLKKEKGGFGFDWSRYDGMELYKLTRLNDDHILGMMCLVDHTDPAVNAIEVELIEASRENIGKKKMFEGIAGCLFAYACRESLKRGHDGYVFLTPKTNLIEHYESQYGFSYWPPMGNKLEGIMVLVPLDTIKLLKRFLN